MRAHEAADGDVGHDEGLPRIESDGGQCGGAGEDDEEGLDDADVHGAMVPYRTALVSQQRIRFRGYGCRKTGRRERVPFMEPATTSATARRLELLCGPSVRR